ncbi:Zinc finger FYVE domain containing protein 1 [Fasciola hepatica]|uniref:Zinc finger FYVE domain containing protein 1 n=1 Tax=Fasciola hepatica TaxID=6192 RepID=A0A4E0QWH5_FASHE|nr:Zinc finger FYVE domain containing protein 1 [Fasciola hepatica]
MHRRLLLKVFAVADIVIYLTKAARLYSDMFSILADASDAFAHHFRPDLEALAQRTGLPWSAALLNDVSNILIPVTKVLRSRFNELRRNVDSFSSLYYIGIQTKDGNTNFKVGNSLTCVNIFSTRLLSLVRNV